MPIRSFVAIALGITVFFLSLIGGNHLLQWDARLLLGISLILGLEAGWWCFHPILASSVHAAPFTRLWYWLVVYKVEGERYVGASWLLFGAGCLCVVALPAGLGWVYWEQWLHDATWYHQILGLTWWIGGLKPLGVFILGLACLTFGAFWGIAVPLATAMLEPRERVFFGTVLIIGSILAGILAPLLILLAFLVLTLLCTGLGLCCLWGLVSGFVTLVAQSQLATVTTGIIIGSLGGYYFAGIPTEMGAMATGIVTGIVIGWITGWITHHTSHWIIQTRTWKTVSLF